jgi:hypothetical protein
MHRAHSKCILVELDDGGHHHPRWICRMRSVADTVRAPSAMAAWRCGRWCLPGSVRDSGHSGCLPPVEHRVQDSVRTCTASSAVVSLQLQQQAASSRSQHTHAYGRHMVSCRATAPGTCVAAMSQPHKQPPYPQRVIPLPNNAPCLHLALCRTVCAGTLLRQAACQA